VGLGTQTAWVTGGANEANAHNCKFATPAK
jgi:hypothetical protein